MTSRPAFRRLFAGVCAIATGSMIAGCYTEGGPGFSLDQNVWISTSWEPKTINVKDNRTGQVLWSYDIPVGRKLVVKFIAGKGTPGLQTPDLMLWDIMAPDDDGGDLVNKIPVPGERDRTVEWSMRPAPELPHDEVPADAAAKNAAAGQQ